MRIQRQLCTMIMRSSSRDYSMPHGMSWATATPPHRQNKISSAQLSNDIWPEEISRRIALSKMVSSKQGSPAYCQYDRARP